LNNRRLLFNAAKKEGLETDPTEFWHWGRMAKINNPPSGVADYGYIALSKENWKHERMCRDIYREHLRDYQNFLKGRKKDPRNSLYPDIDLARFGAPYYRRPENYVSPRIAPPELSICF
jgi:hypothetical protein